MLGAVVGFFVLVGGKPVETGLDAVGVVPPVDVAQQGMFGLGAGSERRFGPIHELDLDGRPEVLGERVGVSRRERREADVEGRGST